MKVMKFGGAALQDEVAIAHAAGIIAAETGPKVIVTSAMAGVTDLLLKALDDLPRGEASVDAIMVEVRRIHAIGIDLDDEFKELERLLYGIEYTQEVSPRLRDLVLTAGERFAAQILVQQLQKTGRPAQYFEAADAGIYSLGPFGNARPDLERQANAIPAALAEITDAIPVVTGFYGVDADGRPTIFGRGGSDFVAALIARAMQADVVELWKDVPGFLSADPKAVTNAHHVPELDYEEAAELAYFGAKVLHARCVEPVQDVGIPIHVRPLSNPAAPGSKIFANAAPAPHRVRSAASRSDLAVLRLSGPGMAETPGIARRVFEALEAADVAVLNLANSQATFALLIADADAVRAEATLQSLIGGAIQSIDVLRDRALVCVVGRGLGEVPGSAARILRSVADAGVNIEMISLGASEIAIDFIVAGADRSKALQGIHAEFMDALATVEVSDD